MLITFSNSVSPDVVLFGDVATIFLRVMGESEQPPGILRGENIKLAGDRLRAWLEQVPESPATDEDGNGEPGDDEARERRNRVGLRQRAHPLLELMQAAYQKHSDVIWR